MKKLLLSSAFICLFAINNSQVFAQEKTNQATTNSNNPVSSPITVNQTVGSWQLHCAYPNNNDKNKQKNTSQGCVAQQSLMVKGKDNAQTPIASLLLEKIKDNQNTTKSNPFRLTVVTPLGFSLKEPIALSIENNNKIDLPWITCTANGCIASSNITKTLQKALETNKKAYLLIHRVNNTTVTINFNIEDLHNVFNTMNTLINKQAP